MIKFNKHGSELLRGASVAFVGKFLGMFLGYIFVLIISRFYGAETMGLYSLSFTILNVLAMLGSFGFDTALVKFVSLHRNDKDLGSVRGLCKKSFIFSILLTLLLSAAVLLIYPTISDLFFDEVSEAYLFIAVACAPFVVFSRLTSAIFRGMKEISTYALINNVLPYFFCSISLVVIYFQASIYYAPILALLLGYVITSVYASYKLRVALLGEPLVKVDTVTLWTGVLVAFPMLLTSSMTLILGWADIIMLGVFTSEKVVGVYSIAVKIAALSSIVLMAITTIAAPKFSELHGVGNRDDLVVVVRNTTKLICLTTVPVVVSMFFLGEHILGVFGKDFMGGELAFQVLLIGQLVNSVCGPVGQFMNMTGHQKALQFFAGISLVVNLVLNFILIQKFEALGAAIATAVSGILWNCMCVVFVFWKEKILLVYIPFRCC